MALQAGFADKPPPQLGERPLPHGALMARPGVARSALSSVALWRLGSLCPQAFPSAVASVVVVAAAAAAAQQSLLFWAVWSATHGCRAVQSWPPRRAGSSGAGAMPAPRFVVELPTATSAMSSAMRIVLIKSSIGFYFIMLYLIEY